MSEHQHTSELLTLIEALLDGTIDDAGFARLDTILRDDAQARRTYRRYINLHTALPALVGQLSQASKQIADNAASPNFDPDTMTSEGFIRMLAQIEATGKEVTVIQASDLEPHELHDDHAALSARDMVAVGGYLMLRSLKTRAALGAIAAALLLAATLVLVFVFSDATTPTPQTAQTPVVPQAVPQAETQTVATLTGEYDARWRVSPGNTAPRLGGALHAGQTLILVDGFAQLTTNDGAVALLLAPCTIDLIDGNTLSMDRGSLCAQVPTQAVGFTVITPTARIVDLGTEFGVVVEPGGATQASVFVGQIELHEQANTSPSPTRSVRLTAGWTGRVAQDGVMDQELFALSPADEVRFVRSLDDVQSRSVAYRRAVLQSRPLVYWRFDEQADRVHNEAGHEQWDGQSIGHTGQASGLFGSAVQLTGQVESLGGFTLDTPLQMNSTRAYTLEVWYRADRPHWGRLFSVVAIDQETRQFWSHLAVVEMLGGETLSETFSAQTGLARFLHRSLSEQDGHNLFSNEPAPVGQWTHLVAVRDGSSSRLYINGELVGEQEDEQAVINDASLKLFIGVSTAINATQPLADRSEYRAFEGLLDEVAIYDRVLTAQMIQEHFNLGRPVTAQ